ncbi:ribosomal protein S6 kinase delta-1-like [Centruroides sculpturatus]|uniref:ribosomal protein S6 kinase delta-1-like n=1 Tax=Centruroides sculpturatus TaxID=218467 RepID=UPI000C6EA7CD|nr:ribosomal protein S6 kinase delta-1-like [Centruroides sculpturatus]
MDQVINRHAKENLYAAPEVGGIFPVTFACDWWSVGALMFELLTGRTLVSCHPGGITAHSNITIPTHISVEARDLIIKLLKYNVSERLGSGPHGVEDIKSHPFFLGYNWNKVYS